MERGMTPRHRELAAPGAVMKVLGSWTRPERALASRAHLRPSLRLPPSDMSRLTTLCAAALAALALASPALGGRGMLVGAAEDAGKALDLVTAKVKSDLAQRAGYDLIRETTIWTPGETAPAPNELETLKNSADAAQLDGIRVILSVYQWGAKTTPLTPTARAQYAAFCASLAKRLPNVHDFIVGNEPNLNRFWWPQFDPNGID